MCKTRFDLTAFVYDRRGVLLSIGKNSYVKTHPLQARAAKKVGLSEKIFLHAEIAAIAKVRDWGKAYRLVVVRFGATGKPLNAKPCNICMEVIKQTGIKKIEHT